MKPLTFLAENDYILYNKKKLSVEVCQLEVIIINAERTFEKHSWNAFLMVREIHRQKQFLRILFQGNILCDLDVFQDDRHNFSIILFLSKNKLRSKLKVVSIDIL